MKTHFALILSVALISGRAWSSEEGMPKMPLIQPKKTYSVPNEQAGEDLLENRGYGERESMVRMMNLMMVTGSGYEGMDMAQMDMKMDAQAKKPGAPAAQGVQGMEGMSGTHDMPSAKKAPPLPSPAEGQSATYDFDAKLAQEPAKVGVNLVVVNIQRKSDQKPAKGLKIKVQVSMTSMDMGTEEPKVHEIAPGTYQVKAVFSMKGPWAVKFILPEDAEKVLNFNVGAK
ncbi:MAG: FixH family protein [Methylotenera sp.]|nr:FixH family protein [Oligoflexia bacterium]